MFISTISLKNNSNELTTSKEISKYSINSSDFLTDDDEKNQEIVNDLEKGLYRKHILSYGGLLKQKHKILNLDEGEDGNLIHTSDEDKTHSIMRIWNFEKQNYYLKASVFYVFCPCRNYSVQLAWLTSFTMQIKICM